MAKSAGRAQDIKTTVVAILAILLSPLPAAGAEPAKVERPVRAADDVDGRNPCLKEIRTLCPDIAPGGGRVIGCLNSQSDKLSPYCKNYVETRIRKSEEARAACADDIGRLCAGATGSGGSVQKCLKQNYTSLTPSCRKIIDEAAAAETRAAINQSKSQKGGKR